MGADPGPGSSLASMAGISTILGLHLIITNLTKSCWRQLSCSLLCGIGVSTKTRRSACGGRWCLMERCV